MHSEVEKLVERLREHATIFGDHEKLMSSQWDVMASMLRKGSHGSLPRDMFEALIDCIGEDTAEAASLIERLYRERETALNMRDQLAKALRQTCGLVVEFGNLNGFRNLSDEELGSAVMGVAREGARVLNLYDAALAEQPQ